MNRRLLVAVVVLLGWAGGLVALARREYFKGDAQNLAELALRVTPETHFYVVEHEGRQVGYASSAIDTTGDGFVVRDVFSADLALGGTAHRASAQTTVRLSRTLALRDFELEVKADGSPLSVTGRTEGDSALAYEIVSAGNDTSRRRQDVKGPILLPTLVSLAATLGEEPEVGAVRTVTAWDPRSMKSNDFRLRIEAESLFVIPDSATFDSTARRWTVAHTDTVRAWRLAVQGEAAGGGLGAGGVGGWVDAQGRLVEGVQAGGLRVRRTVFEVAFENWRMVRDGPDAAPPAPAQRDILASTAIAANARLGNRLRELTVRLKGVELAGLDLAGGRQSLRGDTLVVRVEGLDALTAGYARAPGGGALAPQFASELADEPLLQSRHPEIVALAGRIVGSGTDPREAARRINRWVHDSLRKDYTVSIPDALDVLRQRRGDCNEHVQLYIALARAAGIPARAAAGLAYLDGRFYYHAWPEVRLGDWVAVDPTFGQFPADAAHLRLVTGGLLRQGELFRVIGRLGVEVVDQLPRPPRRPAQTGFTRPS